MSRAFTLRISCERIAAYLNAPELHNTTTAGNTITLKHVTATWHSEPKSPDNRLPFQLKDVSVTFPPGSFTIIAGRLGSGKSTLLLTILGENRIVKGEISAARSDPQMLSGLGHNECQTQADESIKGTWLQPGIAYTPQVAYIEHGTVRSNICFGQIFWKDRYDEVIRACCLQGDIASWPDGDMTELGEGGYVISGEQKYR